MEIEERIQIVVKTVVMSLLCGIFFAAGCRQQRIPDVKKCRGKASLAQAMLEVEKSYSDIKPIRAVGLCNVSSGDFRQSFPVRIWHLPPGRMSMFGEILFDPQALCFAVNGEDFWTYSKHTDSCYYGQAGGGQKFRAGNLWDIRPETILQAIDPVAMARKARSLKNYGPFDILIFKQSPTVVTKIYIETCSYFVKRIEYVDFDGTVLLSVELGDYASVDGSGGYEFPRWINMEFNGGSEELQMRIELNNVKLWEAKKKQLDLMFTRPDAGRFKNVYKAGADGKFKIQASNPKNQ